MVWNKRIGKKSRQHDGIACYRTFNGKGTDSYNCNRSHYFAYESR